MPATRWGRGDPVTPHPRRFRFGVEIQEPFEGRTWADTAREVEDLGYSTLFVPDHFHQGWGPVAAMTAAALATTTLRVAPMVLACDFRNPVVLARELATIDLLSAGRLEVGLGAGYNPRDYAAAGVAMDPPRVRVERLGEHAEVLRALFSGGRVTYTGRHYRVQDVALVPPPHRAGGPPLLIAGGGPLLLRTAALLADIVGINPSTSRPRDASAARSDALPAGIDAKVALVREAAGERFAALELHSWVATAAITDDPEEAAAAAGRRLGLAAEDALTTPLVLAGSQDQIVETLLARRERWGCSYLTLPGPATRALAGVLARLDGGLAAGCGPLSPARAGGYTSRRRLDRRVKSGDGSVAPSHVATEQRGDPP